MARAPEVAPEEPNAALRAYARARLNSLVVDVSGLTEDGVL